MENLRTLRERRLEMAAGKVDRPLCSRCTTSSLVSAAMAAGTSVSRLLAKQGEEY